MKKEDIIAKLTLELSKRGTTLEAAIEVLADIISARTVSTMLVEGKKMTVVSDIGEFDMWDDEQRKECQSLIEKRHLLAASELDLANFGKACPPSLRPSRVSSPVAVRRVQDGQSWIQTGAFLTSAGLAYESLPFFGYQRRSCRYESCFLGVEMDEAVIRAIEGGNQNK